MHIFRSTAAYLALLILVLAGSALGQTSAEAPSPWKLEGNLRVREESWSWFEFPGRESDSRYSYSGAQVRLRVLYSGTSASGLAELQGAGVQGLPERSSLPGAAGQLGLGATYYAHSRQTSASSASVRRAQLDFRLSGSSTLRVGRFDFQDGLESLTGDGTIDWIKKTRVAERLIGPFGFSHFGRSFDGIHFSTSSSALNVTAMVAKPTQGGFEPNFGASLTDVTVGSVALTARKIPGGDLRVFAMQYRDDRDVPLVDNRPVRGRVRAEGGIGITTLGAHFIRKAGDFDVTAWGALQSGSWGRQAHSAWAADIEGGVRFPGAWAKPWLRAGWQIYSGDATPADGTHATFFPMVPTARLYALFPFYTEANLQDRFAQLLLTPTKKLSLRFDYHDLQLAQSEDLWYAGAGATVNSGENFGYGGRPSGGSTDLARSFDVSATYRLSPSTTISAYYGQAWGGEVIGRIYPAGRNGAFTFVELGAQF